MAGTPVAERKRSVRRAIPPPRIFFVLLSRAMLLKSPSEHSERV